MNDAAPPEQRRLASSGLNKTAQLYGWVALGSVLGGIARYLVSIALQFGPAFPWATLFVNVSGSFIIGFYATLSGPDGRLFARAAQRQFVMTGFCGGYTTFSTFSLETFRLLEAGLAGAALMNISASVVASLLAVWIGHILADRLNRIRGT
ncbi:fluoride efflux transporter CrcB [Bradyrhizobium sp. LHD-71]|uniref:fluoride efflux transporter CrcB n=1 Tax=Bradyrhizobium sp. LHD-71 TaxID=3072141 RepID=UPI00280DCA53|nr:fluoride efflux transporter CrcB [Bradyrhizobium sp. LHD-71]MDQ8731033.1 fluoride efflux transporter CrcB [Bradyrhizobium sp. LHD-71]